MVASNYDKDTNELNNITYLKKQDIRLLKSSVIFGANASGKSKFIEAFAFFRSFILESSRETLKGQKIKVEPFRLSEETNRKASEFEMVFQLNNSIYRYGFEANSEKIIAEWLYVREVKKEIELFYRSLPDIDYDQRRLSKVGVLLAEGLVRSNSLLLSVLAQFNDSTANTILDYFRSMNSISGLNESEYKNNSIIKVQEGKEKKQQILELIKSADLGIEDLRFEDLFNKFNFSSDELEGMSAAVETLQKYDPYALTSIQTKHRVFNKENKATGNVEFMMSTDESHGTQKFFHFTGLLLDALENGTILIVDELDSKLHPNLVCKIVSLFNSELTNPNSAQLIFNTHDTNLLSSGVFRRDQIWFVSKNEYGASKLYSLADFKTDQVRKNEAFEENYIRGKYGAVPLLTDFDQFVDQILSSKNGKTQ
jgi:AAA15 family ATPase/GTPase